MPYAAHYAASKHGLLGLDAFACRGICEDQSDRERGLPGLCRHADDATSRSRASRRSLAAARSNARSAITNMNASGRLVDPQAIGNVVAMLCLPLSRDINGAAITIDGGTSA